MHMPLAPPDHALRPSPAWTELTNPPTDNLADDAAQLEVVRRAIGERDEAAWLQIIELYRGRLFAHVRRHFLRSVLTEDDAFYVERAFERFWRATRTDRKRQFNDLAPVLAYLKLCLASVLLDEARAHQRSLCVPIDDVSTDTVVSADHSVQVLGQLAQRELCQAINRELVDENERIVAHQSFVAGLSPREILARHPDKFRSAFDIYRVKANVIDRLRRSQPIRRMLEECSSHDCSAAD